MKALIVLIVLLASLSRSSAQQLTYYTSYAETPAAKPQLPKYLLPLYDYDKGRAIKRICIGGAMTLIGLGSMAMVLAASNRDPAISPFFGVMASGTIATIGLIKVASGCIALSLNGHRRRHRKY